MTRYDVLRLDFDDDGGFDVDGRVVAIDDLRTGLAGAVEVLVERPEGWSPTPATDSPDDAEGVTDDTDTDDSGEDAGSRLEEMTYRDLQELAKACDIPANQSTEELIAALRARE